jgi:hypothetical protein
MRQQMKISLLERLTNEESYVSRCILHLSALQSVKRPVRAENFALATMNNNPGGRQN